MLYLQHGGGVTQDSRSREQYSLCVNKEKKIKKQKGLSYLRQTLIFLSRFLL